MYKKNKLTLCRMKDGKVIGRREATVTQALYQNSDWLVKLDENFFRLMDKVMEDQPAADRMRWQKLRHGFADFAANAHGIIRADKSGNVVLEEAHAYQ